MAACLLVTIASCGSFTTNTNGTSADDHYNNARSYLQSKDYERSMDQVERGLKLDSTHYGLTLMRGWLLTMLGRREPKRYEEALEAFDSVRSMRSSGHDYRLWLLSGEAHQGLYQWHRRVAAQLRRDAESAEKGEAQQKLSRAAEHDRAIGKHIDAAATSYKRLAGRDGEGKFPALERLFLLETDRAIGLEGDARQQQLAIAADRAREYLDANAYRQEHYSMMLELTKDYEQEALGRQTRRALRKRERGFRAAYANLLYELRRWQDARKQLDRVIELDPKIAANYFNRARCWIALQQPNKARRDLQDFTRMTKLSYDSPRVREAYQMLEDLDAR